MNKHSRAPLFLDAALLSAAELSQLDVLLGSDPEEEPQAGCSEDPGARSGDAVLLALDGTDPDLGTSRSLKGLLSLRERGAQAVRHSAVRSRT